MDHTVIVDTIPSREIVPGFRARMIHSEHLTTAFWEIDEGAVLPEHYHVHEQVSIVTSGEFELTIAGEARIYKPGMVAVIPSNVPHAGRAITNCEITDIFSPVREEYR